MDRSAKPGDQLAESGLLHQASVALAPQILSAADMISDAYRKGKKVLLFGNGGSAADAQHIAGELVGRFRFNRPSLPAIALTANSSTVTAIANDFAYESVFERAVEGLVQEGDVVVALSTSGESQNVIKGVEAARRGGARTIAFTGSKGRLASMCDLALKVPSSDTPRIQEVHITMGHIICEIVEEDLYGSGRVDKASGVPRPR